MFAQGHEDEAEYLVAPVAEYNVGGLYSIADGDGFSELAAVRIRVVVQGFGGFMCTGYRFG